MPDLNIAPKLQSTKPRLAARGRQASVFEFILVLLIVILFYMFIVQPKMAELKTNQESLAAAQSQLQGIHTNKDKLSSLESTMKQSTAEVGLLDEALPIDTRITKIHVMLDSLIKAAGMTLASITIDSGQNAVVAGDQADLTRPFAQVRKLNPVVVSLNATGTMEQGIGLLQALESNARLVDADEVNVASDGSGTLSFRLKLKFYYYAPPPGAATKSSP
jgi:Tfp pilus assembly protein PilO